MIDGSILVGATARQREPGFQAMNPVTGEASVLGYSEAIAADVADACALANEADAFVLRLHHCLTYEVDTGYVAARAL